MSEQPFQFPPEEYFQEQKVTPGEEPTKPQQRPVRKKPVLGRFLFFLVLIALLVAGFVTIQNALVDLEAQARIFAAQTATQSGLNPASQVLIKSEITSSPEEIKTTESDMTAIALTATVDPSYIHTATLSILLTQSGQGQH